MPPKPASLWPGDTLKLSGRLWKNLPTDLDWGEPRFRHPALQGLRSFRVRPPFKVHLIFYRYTDEELSAERLMSGRRDLGRRLRVPPGTAKV
jgi:hypothetical protein